MMQLGVWILAGVENEGQKRSQIAINVAEIHHKEGWHPEDLKMFQIPA